MISFILNNTTIHTDTSPGVTLLDFIRYHHGLTGTKIGCREGDCGACTVLVGEFINGAVRYRSVTSCLMPVGNAAGKHIVSIEGINGKGLTPVQQAMCDEGGTQCGFCTPGFVMSLTGFCLQDKYPDVISAIDGNICRCTGYKPIERASFHIEKLMISRLNEDVIDFAVKHKIVPEYFSTIGKRLEQLAAKFPDKKFQTGNPETVVGGGTDLYVQKHEFMTHAKPFYVSDVPDLMGIRHEGNRCIIGASTTVTDLIESRLIRNIFPRFHKFTKLVSSTPIRNMATIGGNFVNASPIGDFTIFFLALNASIRLASPSGKREIPLQDFYKGYKILDKGPDEIIDEITFEIPGDHTHFNFEKVSKRTNLDIASVNTAIKITIEDNEIMHAMLSAGGVGPTPAVLKKTSAFLKGKILNEAHILEACDTADQEISPISDARGTEAYKRLLLKQLIKAHFITLFPTIVPQKLLL